MEKQKYIGGVDFDELRAQRIQVYNTITIDLTTARNDEKMTYTGTYLYVIDASDINTNIQIRLNEQFRNLIPLVKGRGIRAPFYRFYITNTAQAGKTMTLAIGIESETFEIFDVGKALEVTGTIDEIKKLTLISQDDSWHYESDNIRAFMGQISIGTGGSAWAAHVGLWNPSASGINLYVKSAKIMCWEVTEKFTVAVSKHNAVLTTTANGWNKKIGAANSVGLLNSQISGSIIGTEFMQLYIPPDEYTELIDADPIIVPPGTNFFFNQAALAAGRTLDTIIEWIEK